MLAAVNDHGYAGATIADVIARAGVSRRTFYEHFTDKEDCFLALYCDVARCLVDQISEVINDSSPGRAVHVLIEGLTKHAEAQPVQARLLASDVLGAGRRSLEERARTIGRLAGRVETAHARASPRSPAPDVPTQAVIGATQSLIAGRMRRGERQLTQLARELTRWLGRYDLPLGKHRWSTLSPGPSPVPGRDLLELADQLPTGVCFMSSALRSSEAAQDGRAQILRASAQSAVENGYAASSLTAIMAGTGLRKGAFYEHFADKCQAFLALHELAFRYSVSVGAGAYFTTPHWPERVWRCLVATSRLHAAHPAIAHVGLVETHALGLPAIQRVDESRYAFATLLRADGPNTSPRPNLTAAEAIAAAIFEIAYDRVRHQRAEDLPRYAYQATYLALAPFLGVEAADRFVQRKLRDAERTSGSRNAAETGRT